MVHDWTRWKAIQGRNILFEKRLGSSKSAFSIAGINLREWRALSVNVWLKPPPPENDEQAELSPQKSRVDFGTPSYISICGLFLIAPIWDNP